MLIVAAIPLTEQNRNKQKIKMTTNSPLMKRELCLMRPTEYISDFTRQIHLKDITGFAACD
jgi:hypothetical protein